MKINNQFSVKGVDFAKSVTELHNINGAEHLNVHMYILAHFFFDTEYGIKRDEEKAEYQAKA